MFYLLNAKNTFLNAMASAEFVCAIIFGALGFAVICLARRITKTIRKTNFVASDDKAYITLKLIGLMFVIIAFVLLICGSFNS